MRNLAEKVGLFWILLAGVPIASVANAIGKLINLDPTIILSIQIPALLIQVFSVFMLVFYRKVIFKF